MRAKLVSLTVTAALLSACATTNTVTTNRNSKDPDKQPSVRLGQLVWQGNNVVTICTRRIDDNANVVGVAGPCWKAELGKAEMTRIVSWIGAGPNDTKAVDEYPNTSCRFEAKDAQLVPPEQPATLTLVSPTGKQEIYSWPPPAGATADAYRLEPSLSPDGKTLAIVRLQIGIGEGQRVIEPEGVDLREAPACK